MNWIHAYIEAIKSRLPASKREDIGAELETLLEESLEAETGKPSDALREDEILSWLKTRERPSLVASRYHSRRCLVDEESFPLFKLAVRYALIGIVAAHTITAFLSAFSDGSFISATDLAAQILRSGLLAFASLTLVFHFFGHHLNAKESLGSWDPKELPDPNRKWETESYSSSIAGLIFTGIFLLFLNGFLGNASGFLGETKQEAIALLPWINAILIASMALYGVMLLAPRWSIPTVTVDMLLALGAAALCYRLLSITPIFDTASTSSDTSDRLAKLARWADLNLRIILIIVLGVSLYEAGRDLWRLFQLKSRRRL